MEGKRDGAGPCAAGLVECSSIDERLQTGAEPLAEIQVAQYDRTDDRLSEQISKLEDRITLIRETYLQKLQAADALLGRFETQSNIIGASVDSLNLMLYGKRDG